MELNKILDYEQVEEKLEELCRNYAYAIEKQEDLAITLYGLPIHYYKIGKGNKEIVITGATHGAEIVTTDFVLQLMEEMAIKPDEFNLDEYTFHIVPMLNPEGYLITTSAVRKLIPRDMSLEDAQKICKRYYMEYRSDDQEVISRKKEGIFPDRLSTKRHQKMFENIDYTCIPEKYKNIRERVKNIFEMYPDLPKGCIVTWDANASGIDVQSNCVFNRDKILQSLYGEHSYGNLRYENIDASHPGPMNCPFDPKVGFYEIAEVKAISKLLKKLNEKGTLVSYENFHSTGGLVYQRPSRGGNGFEISEDLYWQRIVNNIFMALSYASNTYKNANNMEGSRYQIRKSSGLPTSTNEVFRMKYPVDLLIELSGMGGNPIAPYGDMEGNYKNIMDSNIATYKEFLKNFSVIQKVSDVVFSYIMKKYNNMEKSEELRENYVSEIYELAEEFMKIMKKYIDEGKADKLETVLDIEELLEKIETTKIALS